MNTFRHALLAVSLLAVFGGAQARDWKPPTDTAYHQLVEQIWHAETIYRDDLLNDAAERLQRLAPDAPEALFAKLYLAVRQGNLRLARSWLAELTSTQPPHSPYVLRGKKWIELAVPANESALAEARLLAAVGRIEESREAYDALLQGIVPTADLALEYWQLRGRQDGQAERSFAELQAWLDRYPKHAGFLTAVANGHFSRDQPEVAVSLLRRLGRLPGRADEAAARELEYLGTLPPNEITASRFQDFLSAYPDTAVHAKARDAWQEHRELLDDPVWRNGQAALRSIEAGRGAEALRALQRAVQAYPNDADFMGGLGLAFLRTGERDKALFWFQKARDSAERVDRASAWVSLIESTRYWMLLERAAEAYDAGDLEKANRLYTQAYRQDPSNLLALIGLGDTALSAGDDETAWHRYRQAFQIAPQDEMSQRAVERYLLTLAPAKALTMLDTFSPGQQTHLQTLRRRFRIAELSVQADQAIAKGQWTAAVTWLAEAQTLDPDDPWLSYRLAVAMREDGHAIDGITAFEHHLRRHPTEGESRHAHALLLESVDAWQQGRVSLRHVKRDEWTEAMEELDQRLADRLHIAEATRRMATENPEAGMAYLKSIKPTRLIKTQLADWYLLYDSPIQALQHYQSVLQESPTDVNAMLGILEARLALGETDAVSDQLHHKPPSVPDTDIAAQRRLGMIWAATGASDKAIQILQDAVDNAEGPEPWLYRDLARVVAEQDVDAALGWYTLGLRDAGLLSTTPSEPAKAERFTRALRTPDEPEDWLASSLRRDASTLYQRRNPSITVSTDIWLRRDGTPGLSRLNASTSIAQLEYPLADGRAFVRAEHSSLDAGRYGTNPNGEIDTNVGTCEFSGFDTNGDLQSLAGCTAPGGSTKAKGQTFAFGWQNERFAFDIGRTPASFPVSNWVGGASVDGDIGTWGWRLRLSRRPVASSVLSYAGMQDPRTGLIWGGVVATGGGVALSWDQGERDGIWLNMDHHKLSGKYVADNWRSRLMGGYYRRLLSAPNQELSVGVNLMHWRYRRNLSEYTVGHGGYYSPQRYTSVSFPLSYARRTPNWSFAIRGAISHAWTRTSDTDAYPLPGAVAGPLQDLTTLGVTQNGFLQANQVAGGNSRSWGYSLQGAVERRLGSHWLAGATMTLQHGEDFAPSRFMLYLRYSFDPWLGDLRLPPQAPELYVDFD